MGLAIGVKIPTPKVNDYCWSSAYVPTVPTSVAFTIVITSWQF